ncbi:transposase [Vibrio sp. SNU_ST1]|uniref:transposase n=1 Tax=Vibrio sp. SNU_ST1 TaxID=3064001 RepID=UPI00272B22C0|nr:transposase [Vibrio sp. SNU_ST1]WKY60732.1 transposase [Vibrio sp. SNU_ST1]
MSDYSYFCGIDLAKNHFSLHAVDQNGKVILHKSVNRSKLLTTIANMPLMRIGVEACGGAHYWVRTLNKLGHDTRIMAVKYVTPYRTKGKNDLNDAAAIYEAVQRPSTPKQWVVDCRQVGYGQSALNYLARYLYRGVLPDEDITHITDDTVTFRYKESQTNAWRTRTLPTLKFLLLILQHVLPKGLQRVRNYGFLRGQAYALRARIQLLLLNLVYRMPPLTVPIRSKAIRTCPCCSHEMACVGVSRPM